MASLTVQPVCRVDFQDELSDSACNNQIQTFQGLPMSGTCHDISSSDLSSVPVRWQLNLTCLWPTPMTPDCVCSKGSGF